MPFLPQSGGGRIPNPPSGGAKTSALVGSNPGLITSTGGLFGDSGILVTPAYNISSRASSIITHDSSDFNCEESAEYDYRQEANAGQISYEGRDVSCHLVILKYRELGIANFSINITVFNRDIDDFITTQIPVSIPVIDFARMTKNRKKNFPDKRIHTVRLSPPNGVIQGERPQVTITRDANSGPISITKLILCGNADEAPQQ